MNTFTIAGLIFLGLGLALIFPFLIIWALNTLFALALAYTWTNWLAVFVIWSALAVLRNN